jgi:dTDP-4-amino-4,6-dideoxygalactose transaminase
MNKEKRKIPFINYYLLNKQYENEFCDVLSKLIDTAWLILGKNVTEFEKNYAEFNQTKYCIGVANGLDALILSLKALGIQKGDEVIVPSNTYIASWLAVTHVGAVIVPVEPRKDTCNINPEEIVGKITSRTKAVMAVNLYGQSAELDTIKKICDEKAIYLIEDNAQAQGAKCNGRITGSFGVVNSTSFYPGKNIGALGDAGAITTNDDSIVKKVKTLRNYGSEIKYYNETIGYNSRLDELQAGFLKIKLTNLEKSNEKRTKISKLYDKLLNGVGDLILPQLASGCTSVYHIYQVRTNQRDSLQKFLSENGVATMIHYPIPPHLQKAYSHLGFKKGDFPIAENIAETTLSLPLDPFISDDDIAYVCECICAFFDKQ